MHQTAAPATPAAIDDHAYRRRWLTLGVLCFSLVVITLDNTILNVALPTLVRDLSADNSQLQWIVDAYTLVFAGLLLTAGSLGDRYGRRGAFQVGLLVFGLGSAASALASTPNQLVVTRGLMGIGGAFIMPSTLSILTNVFPPHERGRAIGVWAGVAGVGVALGPLTGGFLLEHFWWGSVFLVNLPVVGVGLLASIWLVPTSRDPARPRQDPLGALLSIVGLVALLYGIIQAPERGWTAPPILASFAAAVLILALFAFWELRTEQPMLDMRFFANPRFTAASVSVTAAFFAMFGSTFLFTQHMQFVMGFTPLEAGVRMLPFAGVLIVVAPTSARLVERVGTKLIVATGLTIVAVALTFYVGLSVDDGYGQVMWRMMLMAMGMALTMAPATESIMESLPKAKAGVGSAVNDTTRMVGGSLGVAIIGSVMSSAYATRITDVFAGRDVPPEVAETARSSLGGALALAAGAGGEAGATLARAAKEAFVVGLHRGVLVAAAASLLGALIALRYLPASGVEVHELPAPAEAVQPPGDTPSARPVPALDEV